MHMSSQHVNAAHTAKINSLLIVILKENNYDTRRIIILIIIIGKYLIRIKLFEIENNIVKYVYYYQ